MDLKKLALACGSVGGVEVTEEDVRNALRAKTYSQLIGRDGLLPPMEMARLKRNVRHAVATRLVAEENARTAKQRGAKPIVAKSNPAWFRSQRQDTLIDQALKSRRELVPMAKGFLEPSYQQQQKLRAWQEFNRGPGWLRNS
jgi:hypothetical protein